MSFHRWLHRREYGLPPTIGDRNLVMQRIYKSIEPFHHWNGLDNMCANIPDFGVSADFGAVFNLEFSPEGNVLVAACEKKTILLFDAITTKYTNKITDAHTDNVNCIKFLDNRLFATCSDDTTVALWDLRYLKMKVRTLHGHSNWVKNIEYSHKDNLLVTSGFDGSIFTWDINSHTEHGLIYQKVFHTSGLMRCRIAPDGTKLVICTTGGYLMIIHNLDLATLHKDLCGFRPGIYRLMQMGNQYIPQAAKFDHVFSKKQKKNRVELVTDFPEKNDAEVIMALQIHPHGHSFLSRNISYDELTEWSCVHDIIEEPEDVTENTKEPSAKRKRLFLGGDDDDGNHEENNESNDERVNPNGGDDVLFSITRRPRTNRNRSLRIYPTPQLESSSSSNQVSNVQTPNRPELLVPDIWAAEVTVEERAIRQNRARSSNSVTGYNFVYAISSGVLSAQSSRPNLPRLSANTSYLRRSPSNATGNDESRSSASGTSNTSNRTDASTTSNNDNSANPLFRRIRVRSLISPFPNINTMNRKIFQNPKKLMYYIQESNKGKGFIKEPCFSLDGRIICSPYDAGIRLLGFSENCCQYPRHNLESRKRNPQLLTEIKNINSHTDIVLSTKFSPREPLLVAGCRSGKVVWYHPNL